MKLLDTKVYKMRDAENPKNARNLKVSVYVTKGGEFVCMLPQYLDGIGESIISRQVFAVGLLTGIKIKNEFLEKAYSSTKLSTLSEFIQSCIKSYDSNLFEKKVKDEKVILVEFEFESRVPRNFKVCKKHFLYMDYENAKPVYSYEPWEPQKNDTSFLAKLAKADTENKHKLLLRDRTSQELDIDRIKELPGTEKNAEYFLLIFSFLANMKNFLLPSDWWYYVDPLKNKNPIEKKLESLRIINKEIQKK